MRSTTALQIALEGAPLLLIYNWNSGSHCLETEITLTENAGVSTTIDKVDFKFLKGSTIRETHTLPGGNLAANGKLSINVNLCISDIHDGLRIDVAGSNANNQQITSSKNVNIEYISNLQGTYKGPSLGVSGGIKFTNNLTLEIIQEGKILTGSWALDDGGPSGTLSGTIVGDDVTAIMELVIPCTGLLNVEASIEGNGFSFKGLFKGSTYCRGDMEGDFSVNRQ
ncbi:MAG: hypothetical protein GQ544_10245 [Candidatus Aminicenantes bacterium]|nr:hypothetical protein [Candidatus Aminicenantes bacterium]